MQTIPRFNIIWKEKVDSTNSFVLEGMDGYRSRTVIASLSQNSGRGQGSHVWHSADGLNLTFSILVKYEEELEFKAAEQQLLTAATSLAVLDYLGDEELHPRIKMPNDIYLNGKKICGMLIENGLSGDAMRWSIIGIGLNVNETDFPEDLPDAVSMSMATGRTYDIKKCLEEFLRHFSLRFDAIWTEPEVLKKDYYNNLIALKR